MRDTEPQITKELLLRLLPRNEMEGKIVRRRLKGMTFREIAEEFNVSDFVIHRYHKLAKIKVICCLATQWEQYKL